MLHRLKTPACLLGALLTACGDDGRETGANTSTPTTLADPTATPGTTGTPTEATDAGTTAAATDTGTDDSSDTGVPDPSTTTTNTTPPATSTTVDDTGPDPDTGETTDPTATTTGFDTCQRVDFLFVVDNSVSMEGEQSELTAAFPAFIQTIQEQVPATDYHIMVVDTDDTGRCGPNMCTHSTCQAADQYACQDIFSECDITRGAGVVHPAGEYTQNMPCDFDAGKRYLESSDPNLSANFECAAKVGTAGNPSERPLDGMYEALSPALTGPGGCNEGFLRDDAILVVTFISDDPNKEDTHSAQEVYDQLVAAKNGNATSIVMLGLITGNGCGGAQQPWEDLIAMFGERGIQGGVCDMMYNEFFQNAVATIADTCVINPG